MTHDDTWFMLNWSHKTLRFLALRLNVFPLPLKLAWHSVWTTYLHIFLSVPLHFKAFQDLYISIPSTTFLGSARLSLMFFKVLVCIYDGTGSVLEDSAAGRFLFSAFNVLRRQNYTIHKEFITLISNYSGQMLCVFYLFIRGCL